MVRLLVLVLVLLPAFAALAFAAEDLSASLATSNVVDMGNCGPDEGPFTKSMGINIINEWNVAMIVDYEYYDFLTGTWQPAGRLCAVPPNQLMTCQGTLRTTLGGEGNGTIGHALIRATGRNEATGATKSRTFDFILTHHTSDKELARISELDALVVKMGETDAALNGTCAGGICCGLSNEKAFLASAEAELADYSYRLKSCALNGLYASIVSATTSVNRANSTNLSSCYSTLPHFNSTKADMNGAGAAIRSGEACRANVLVSKERMQQAEFAFGNATLAVGRDEYASASALLVNASRLAGEAESNVGECGGTLWNQTGAGNGTGNGTGGDVERDSNTTGGSSDYVANAGAQAAGGGGICPGMFILLAASAFAALRKSA